MMPAASIEIAIGMNTISLTAAPQRTRSASTANTSPRQVTMVGPTSTQTALFRSAVKVAGSVKSSA